MYNVIKDPKSKKFVPINSKKGQRILKNYIQFVESNEQFGGGFFGDMMKKGLDMVDKIRNKKKKKKKKDNTDKKAHSLIGALGEKIKNIPNKISELTKKILHIEETIKKNNDNSMLADKESEKELNIIKNKIKELKSQQNDPNSDNSKEIEELQKLLTEKTEEAKKKQASNKKVLNSLEEQNEILKKQNEILQEQNKKLDAKINSNGKKNRNGNLNLNSNSELIDKLGKLTEKMDQFNNEKGPQIFDENDTQEDFSDDSESDDNIELFGGDDDDDKIRKKLYKNEDELSELSGLNKMIESL